MIHQEYAETDPDTDSDAEKEIMNGLMAARQYKKDKPRLSPAEERELLDGSFPHLPGGDGASEMTEEERTRFIASIKEAASERTTRSIANLREQLAEYHSLLDELSYVTAKCEALEKTCQQRGCRIGALEQEMAVLKKSHQGNELPLGLYNQAQSTFCDMCEFLQATPHITPGPSPMMPILESNGIVHPTVPATGYSPSQWVECNNGYQRTEDLSEARPKQPISYGYDNSSSSSGMMCHKQKGMKRFKSDAFATPEFKGDFEFREPE